MREKIQKDLQDAMRAKDELRLSVLRMVNAAIQNKTIEQRAKNGGELTDEEVVGVIRSEVKKRKDAITEFRKGNREELAQKEEKEAEILQAYLPAELSDENVEKVVGEVVAGVGEVTQKDFGRVMGEVMKRIGGQASGDRVSSAVKKLLNG